ncbi:hypothetical protein HDV05_007203 [Chytridiales sp. JEL 0842]|nr:hypothetical protein HDV05_007203 [Chytridiales sp. JEL 0842]
MGRNNNSQVAAAVKQAQGINHQAANVKNAQQQNLKQQQAKPKQPQQQQQAKPQQPVQQKAQQPQIQQAKPVQQQQAPKAAAPKPQQQQKQQQAPIKAQNPQQLRQQQAQQQQVKPIAAPIKQQPAKPQQKKQQRQLSASQLQLRARRAEAKKARQHDNEIIFAAQFFQEPQRWVAACKPVGAPLRSKSVQGKGKQQQQLRGKKQQQRQRSKFVYKRTEDHIKLHKYREGRRRFAQLRSDMIVSLPNWFELPAGWGKPYNRGPMRLNKQQPAKPQQQQQLKQQQVQKPKQKQQEFDYSIIGNLFAEPASWQASLKPVGAPMRSKQQAIHKPNMKAQAPKQQEQERAPIKPQPVGNKKQGGKH